MKYSFGITVKDKITGFKGVITGFCTYITGCDQYLLAPPVDKEGKPVSAKWIDEIRLEVVKKKKQILLEATEVNGSCESAPVR